MLIKDEEVNFTHIDANYYSNSVFFAPIVFLLEALPSAALKGINEIIKSLGRLD